MQAFRDAVLLRIYIGESDRFEGKPLYEALVLKARDLHMAGATVLRGPMGFGRSSHLHTAKILRLSMDLPMVIEIVDSEEKIRGFLPTLDGMMGGGLMATGTRLMSLGLGIAEIKNVTRELFRFGRDKIGADQMGEIIAGTPALSQFA